MVVLLTVCVPEMWPFHSLLLIQKTLKCGRLLAVIFPEMWPFHSPLLIPKTLKYGRFAYCLLSRNVAVSLAVTYPKKVKRRNPV